MVGIGICHSGRTKGCVRMWVKVGQVRFVEEGGLAAKECRLKQFCRFSGTLVLFLDWGGCGETSW